MEITRGFTEPEHAAQTVAAALQAFDEEMGSRQFGELVVLIACLNEGDNLGAVLEEVLDNSGGLVFDLLVVDDGSEDDTAAVARRYGVNVIRFERNCGHGMALRAGYRAAAERGARYIATLDGDGQWDPADLPKMVDLVRSGQADFVIGSRVLGETQNTDWFRNLGVQVFSYLTYALTGVKVTDTSSGLRVMTTDVALNVRQTQPQWQTSELVVGAALAGYKIVEVPTLMRPRLSGASKKGRNVTFGLSYARALIGTWLRESRHGGLRQSKPVFGIRIFRYAASSVICLGVAEATLAILVLAGMQGWKASVIASAAGIIPGYPLNRTWAFGRRGRRRHGHAMKEVVPYLVAAVVTAVFAALLVGAVSPWARREFGTVDGVLVDMAVYVLAYGLMWLLKFAYMDRLLFRVPTEEEAAVPGPHAHGVPSDGRDRVVQPAGRAQAVRDADLNGGLDGAMELYLNHMELDGVDVATDGQPGRLGADG